MYTGVTEPHLWEGLIKIIFINIILSGDNAVVIAMACHALPLTHRKKAIFLGTVATVLLLVVMTAFAAFILRLPYLKLVGSLLLLWVGIKLLLSESEDPLSVEGNSDIFSAIKTIVIADLTMSLDNVLGVAAVANGHFILIIIGLFVSVPLVIYGSTLIAKLMARFSSLIILGTAFIGYIAGEMAVSESMVRVWLQREISPHYSSYIPFATAVLVILIGKWIAAKRRF